MQNNQESIIEKYISTPPDTSIRYWEAGTANPQTVILIHGIGAAIESWTPLFDFLSPHYHVIAIDIPGFGKSRTKKRYRNPKQALDYFSFFLNAKKLKHFTLIAHSLGGFATLEYANRHPERVQKLVLIASAGFGKPSFRFRFLASPFSKYLLLPLVKTQYLGPEIFRFFYGDGLAIGSLRKLSEHWKNRSVLNSFVDVLRMSDTYQCAEISEITCPTLILWGKKDWILKYSQALIAHKKLKNSELLSFDEYGHGIHTENPDIINSIILNFLNE